MTDIQVQKNVFNGSRLKRIILLLVLAVAISGAFDPDISRELESSPGHLKSGFNAIQTIVLRFSRDCIHSNTYRSNDQSTAFGNNIRNAGSYSSYHFTGRMPALSGSAANYYTRTLLLNIGSIISLLSLFHIFYIHLRDGKK